VEDLEILGKSRLIGHDACRIPRCLLWDDLEQPQTTPWQYALVLHCLLKYARDHHGEHAEFPQDFGPGQVRLLISASLKYHQY
jgi:hypothetical protein